MQSFIYASWYGASTTQIEMDCSSSIIDTDSKTSSTGDAEIKTQGKRETDMMVGRRDGLQSIQRDGET